MTGPGAEHEVGRLLRQTAGRIEEGQEFGRLTEYNGNGCGRWTLNAEKPEYGCEDCGEESTEEHDGQTCRACGRGVIRESDQ
jgi:hypothetical protein